MNIIKDKSIKKQIQNNGLVVFGLSIIFYMVLCFFKRYNFSVILGIVLGSSYSVLNFLFIAVSMERLILMLPNKVKIKAFFHYIIRFLLMGIFIAVVVKSGKIDIFAFFVALFFSKVAIFIQAFLEYKN